MPRSDVGLEGVAAIEHEHAGVGCGAVVRGDPGEIAVDDEDGVGRGEVLGVCAGREEGDASVVGVGEGDVDGIGGCGVDGDGEESGEGEKCGDGMGVAPEEGGDDEWVARGKEGRTDAGCGCGWKGEGREGLLGCVRGKVRVGMGSYQLEIRRWVRLRAISGDPGGLPGVILGLLPPWLRGAPRDKRVLWDRSLR